MVNDVIWPSFEYMLRAPNLLSFLCLALICPRLSIWTRVPDCLTTNNIGLSDVSSPRMDNLACQRMANDFE